MSYAHRSCHQVPDERADLRSEPLELLAASLVGAHQIEAQVSDTCGVELADFLGYLSGSANCTVALRGGAHVHGVAHAERLGRFVQGLLVAVTDAGEHEVCRTEALELAPGLGGRCLD